MLTNLGRSPIPRFSLLKPNICPGAALLSGSISIARKSHERFWLVRFFALVILVGELGQFIGLSIQIISKSRLFFRTELTTQLFSFALQFVGPLDHCLILGHVSLSHRLIGQLEIIDVRIIALEKLVCGLAAECRAFIAACR